MNKKSEKEIQYWESHILRWQSGDLSKREYCRRKNLSYWTFRDRIKKQDASGSKKKLVKLPKAIHSYSETAEAGIEIKISNKVSIIINRGFDGELLRNLLKEIGVFE